MAWPYSGNYESRTAGTTTVKKAWADSIDGALNGIFGGTKSLQGLVYRVSTDFATQTRPGSGDGQPFEYSTDLPTSRKLIRQWAISTLGGAGTIYQRIYHTTSGYELTINASYAISGAQWSQDSAAQDSYREVINFVGTPLQWQRQTAGSAAWADGSWTTLFQGFSTGDFSTSGKFKTTSTRTSGTPGSGQSVNQGELWADLIPIAMVKVKSNAIDRSVNLAAAGFAHPGAGKYTFTLQVGAPAQNPLQIQATCLASGAAGICNAYPTITTPGFTFEVDVWSTAGAAVDGDFQAVVWYGGT